MDYVCPDCGYESENPGNCPECETPLLRREDVDLAGAVEPGADLDGEEKVVGDLEKDEDDDEEW